MYAKDAYTNDGWIIAGEMYYRGPGRVKAIEHLENLGLSVSEANKYLNLLAVDYYKDLQQHGR